MTTTIEAMKQADYVLASVLAVSPDSITTARAALNDAIKREEAQTVDPDHIADPRKIVSGDREALISAMRMYKAAYPESKHFGKVADMLAADELEIEATTRQVEILSDELSKCSKLTQQVAVPQGSPRIDVTEDMHQAAVKVLHRASGLDGLPQRMLDAMLSAAPPPQAVTQKSGDAHENWVAAQLAPGEGIADGVARVETLLDAPEQEPFGWTKSSEIEQSQKYGGSVNVWRKKYDCDVPLYTKPQPVAELSDAEINIAWRSVDYTVPYEQFRVDIARAVLAAQRGKA